MDRRVAYVTTGSKLRRVGWSPYATAYNMSDGKIYLLWVFFVIVIVLVLNFIVFLHMCMIHMGTSCVEAREQLLGVGSLPVPHGRSHSGRSSGLAADAFTLWAISLAPSVRSYGWLGAVSHQPCFMVHQEGGINVFVLFYLYSIQ